MYVSVFFVLTTPPLPAPIFLPHRRALLPGELSAIKLQSAGGLTWPDKQQDPAADRYRPGRQQATRQVNTSEPDTQARRKFRMQPQASSKPGTLPGTALDNPGPKAYAKSWG